MKTKRRILFVVNRMNVGGVEKSLLGVVNALPADRYDIHIGVLDRSGGFLPLVPDTVHLFELPALLENRQILLQRIGALPDLALKKTFKALKLVGLYLMAKLSGTLIPFYKGFIDKNTDKLSYDVAVTFQGPSELLDYYITRYVEAPKKICWIHFDIDRFFVRPKSINLTYSAYDKIFVVSEQAKVVFDRKFPRFSDKTEVMLNIIDRESNVKLADEHYPLTIDNDVLSIVTVGRICAQKAQDIALAAAEILKSRGVKFKWIFIGGGDEIEAMERLSDELGVSDNVMFTGALNNPYPYMKHCSVYVQPSRYEGFCIAIGEAKLFGVPIVATDFVGAREQLQDVANAQIVPAPDAATIADAIVRASKMGRIEASKEGIPPQVDRLVEIFG